MVDLAPDLEVASPVLATDLNKPYKGADSFSVEDGELFYGREQEARELTARVLSSRLTVLYAPSGAGKTSLLNARLIPRLEESHWAAIRVRIDNDPIEAVRFSILQYLMPTPASELAALRSASRELGVPGSGTLDALAEAFDRLELSDERYRRLIGPVRSPEKPSSSMLLKAFGNVTPMVNRFLRGGVDVTALNEHFTAIMRLGGEEVGSSSPLDWGSESIDSIATALTSPELTRAYEGALGVLYPPIPGLRGFIENVFATYGAHRSDFFVVLILDQFEELFTRFVDTGSLSGAHHETLPDWRLREAFLREIEELYSDAPLDATTALLAAGRAAGNPFAAGLPLRFVIALREEYVGRLDRLRTFAPEVNDSTYRLGLLSEEHAREAILEPALEFGLTYQKESVDAIVTTLAREGFIEPFLLQIVCDRLWHKLGKSLARERRRNPAPIGKDAFEKAFPHGVQEIVDAYFTDLMATLQTDGAKADAIELMELLITGVGTRNMVEERVLVEAPFRSRDRRQTVLDTLVAGRFLRRERRLGSFFVEITHECLIASVQAQVREQVHRSRELRGALRTLDGIRRGDLPWLNANEFSVLDANRSRVEWPRWAVALMVQSAAVQGSPQQVRHWIDVYRQGEPTGDLSAIPISGEEEQRFLTIEELHMIQRADTEAVGRRLAGQELRVLRSLLWAANANDTDTIRHWARKALAS